MKRFLKALTVAAIAAVAAIACVFAFGCAKDKDKDDVVAADYVFVIKLPNGDPLNGTTANNGQVPTGICIGENCVPLDMQNIYPDANGKVSLTQAQVNTFFASSTDVTVFDFHVYAFGDYKEAVKTVNGKNTYTITLENN